MLCWWLRKKVAFIVALAAISHAAAAIQFHLNRDMLHELIRANVSDYPLMIAWLVGYIDTPLYNALEVVMVWSPTTIIVFCMFISATHCSFLDCDPTGE